jgi:uncharacterized protein YjiS (DUF1127 family)
MATYNVKSHPAFAGYDLPESNDAFGGFRSVFQGLANWAAGRRAYHQTVSELNGLTDRELADIGIVRCDIQAVARDAANVAKANR